MALTRRSVSIDTLMSHTTDCGCQMSTDPNDCTCNREAMIHGKQVKVKVFSQNLFDI